jgi:mono/diheme cytochrome c family protein
VTRLLPPLAAGLAAAAVAFAAVALATDSGGEPASDPATSSAPSTGRDLFASMGCGSCHRLAAAGSVGQIGPDLDAALPDHTRDSLMAKIRDPGPTVMPDDFDDRMTDPELSALVDFLLSSR